MEEESITRCFNYVCYVAIVIVIVIAIVMFVDTPCNSTLPKQMHLSIIIVDGGGTLCLPMKANARPQR